LRLIGLSHHGIFSSLTVLIRMVFMMLLIDHISINSPIERLT